MIASAACKKRTVNELDAAPPAIGELPPGEGGWFEDEASSFRIHLPANPVLAEEVSQKQGAPTLSHTAQIKEDDDEILVMWTQLVATPGAAEQDQLLDEVVAGWAKAGMTVTQVGPTKLSRCAGRMLAGRVDKKQVDARVLVCDDTLIQLVTSGRFVEDALDVFETFEWLGS